MADSDSDLPEDMDEDDKDTGAVKSKGKKQRNTFIRENPEDVVDLADIKSIGNVLSMWSSRTQIFYYKIN